MNFDRNALRGPPLNWLCLFKSAFEQLGFWPCATWCGTQVIYYFMSKEKNFTLSHPWHPTPTPCDCLNHLQSPSFYRHQTWLYSPEIKQLKAAWHLWSDLVNNSADGPWPTLVFPSWMVGTPLSSFSYLLTFATLHKVRQSWWEC